MASPSVGTRKIIERFISVLSKHIDVADVYLFGSHAKGLNRKYSDIDIAIVSKDFKRMKPFERLVFLGKVAWEAKTPIIEAIGYTPQEFATRSPLDFPSEIKEHGMRIKPACAADPGSAGGFAEARAALAALPRERSGSARRRPAA